MDHATRERLEAAGFKIETVAEFLQLTPEGEESFSRPRWRTKALPWRTKKTAAQRLATRPGFPTAGEQSTAWGL